MARYDPIKNQEEYDEALEEWNEMYPEDEYGDDHANIDFSDYLGWSNKEWSRFVKTGQFPVVE